jgi:single-strand DNA-binding protein
MANLNKVFLMGNLTRDPQVTYLPSNQTAVCEIGMAVNRKWTGQDGQQKEEVMFVDCTAFGRQAETLGKYVKKGRPLFVEGRLKLDQWEKDGVKRSKMRIVIEGFQFIDGLRPGGEFQPEGGEARPAAAPRQQYARPAGRPAAQPAPAQPVDDFDSMPQDDGPPPPDGSEIPF